MRRTYHYAIGMLLLASSVSYGASLNWDYDTSKGEIPPTATVQKSATATGLFADVATIPSLPSTYNLPLDAYGFYRIMNLGGVSNVAEYPQATVDLTDVYTQLSALNARVTALEQQLEQMNQPPVSEVNNISASQLNVDQVEIVGVNCTSLKTTGTGLKRIVTCVH